MIAIAVKTFQRDDCLYRFIDSVKKYFNEIEYKLYIVDDGKQTIKKTKFYENQRHSGHEVILLPFNSGLSKGRNVLLENITEKNFILCDDDFIFNQKIDFKWAIKLLNQSQKYFLVAGKLINIPPVRFECYDLKIEDETIYQIRNDEEWLTFENKKYKEADYVRNFFIGDTEKVKKVGWDENFKIAWEHIDFFLRAKRMGYKPLITDSFSAIHKQEIPNGYNEYRRNCDVTDLYKKYGVKQGFYIKGNKKVAFGGKS